ncbi:MAG: PilN domain-containing protein [Proteobacteria bacterium]|nr:PilN domain-containing protein [Pseudomonadota bacterium]MBU4067574.1 PilN domain-containing protein [Pseudomonadota bacterium]MBU4126833.1 PilN domain-containing protein [Pseudomonadota bacterium]
MIKVNLLPFRAARKKENIRRQVSIFFLLTIFVALCMYYYNISLNNKINDYNVKIENIKNEVAKYNQITKEVEDIKNRLDVLNKKTGVIKNLELNRKEPVRLLDIMTSMVIPKQMWFTNLEAKEEVVTIKGFALDNKTVADFMTRLEESKLFDSVNLMTLKQQSYNKNINLKGFVISCNKTPHDNAGTDKATKQ